MEGKKHPLRFKIVRTNPDSLKYEFTNDIIITHDRENFYIQFGQVSPPQISGQEDLENMAVLGAIESPAVSRLVMDKAYIPTLIRALQDNLNKHEVIHKPKNPETASIKFDKPAAGEFGLDMAE